MKKFTLIELLIAVAIIGILLSLLMPSLEKAREKTRIAVCQSNLSQIYRACFVYAHDYNRRLPPPGNNTGHSGSGSVWTYTMNQEVADALHLYLNSKQTENTVFHCPSNPDPPRGEKTVKTTDLWLMDHYSLVTHLKKLNSANLLGKHSPEFMDQDGVILTETMIWWKSPADSSWGSNHGQEGDRSTVWTELKLDPYGYNQTMMNGSVKFMNVGILEKASPMAKINAYWLYWVED